MHNPTHYPDPDPDAGHTDGADTPIHEPRLWREGLWTAQVMKNEDDDGWAVAMYRADESEPALVGPWTMGRDKKNPKPLDSSAFITLVKTASECVRRSEQQLHATLHPSVVVNGPSGMGRVTVCLDIVPDDDHPTAVLTATDEAGNVRAEANVPASFQLNRRTAQAWIDSVIEGSSL